VTKPAEGVLDDLAARGEILALGDRRERNRRDDQQELPRRRRRRGPFGDDARTYYDPDLRALALGVHVEVPPGGRWQYNNFHPLLLGMILERATGRTVSAYLSEKLWRPLGMEAPGSWSLDSRHDGFEKMESGLNARAIDFAKFGRLYLRGGTWEGRQLLPRAWVDASTRHDSTVAGPRTSPPGEEWARPLDYGYMWWIDPKAPGHFFVHGQPRTVCLRGSGPKQKQQEAA
jgi:CubicO group peptidase (beta-lactamase class C family)